MTNLAKVMSVDTDFEAIFDRATTSLFERFGQSISQALDSYTEFANPGLQGRRTWSFADHRTYCLKCR
jgi:hypothetical protein